MSAIQIVTTPKNWLDRLTSSTLFTVLFTISVLLVTPLLLVGLVVLVAMLASADAGSIPLLGFVGGGIAGLVGLFRGRARAWPISSGSVEATILCLVAGVAAALAVVAGLLAEVVSSEWLESRALVFVALVAAPHGVLIVAGIASLERLPRRYLKMTGEPFDSLPVICLLVALGLTVGAVFATLSTWR